MARRKHYWGRSPLPHDGGPRLWRMILFLFILGMMYTQMRRASNWRWLVGEAQGQTTAPAANPASAGNQAAAPTDPNAGSEAPATPAIKETIRESTTDQEDWEKRVTRDSLSVVTDKTELQEAEMPAYWMLMRWTLAQTSRQLLDRAAPRLKLSDLWATPADFRGRIFQFPLEVRRVESFEVKSENSAGVKSGYMMVGMNEASKAQPYWVVVPDLPEGWPVADEVYESGTFVGYFLKWQWYQPGVGKPKSMPMFIGRIIPKPKAVIRTTGLMDDPLFLGLAGVAALGALGFAAYLQFSPRPARAVLTPTRNEETAVEFLKNALPASSPAPPAPAAALAPAAPAEPTGAPPAPIEAAAPEAAKPEPGSP